ncbi:MAG: endonuclease/exonuclease/phosphatase family protein [Chloroflexia bacterium]|nr:endonuclease/exonuclease/phosphatase family protein [Chloroflexia bacterium]
MTTIRVATYNLWASDIQFAERLDAACAELTRVNPDVLALQEVRHTDPGNTGAASSIGERTGLNHMLSAPGDPGETDAPALLSKHPLSLVDPVSGRETAAPPCVVRAWTSVNGVRLAITNVHLDWRSIASRERQIVAVIDWIAATGELDRHEVLLGDFNCTPESSVYRFLMGQQTIAGRETVPWHDLAQLQAVRNGWEPGPTLDFENNPRWAEAPTLDVPARVDWILIRDCFAKGLPYPKLADAGLFGVTPPPSRTVVPSDHYGVFADLAFPE